MPKRAETNTKCQGSNLGWNDYVAEHPQLVLDPLVLVDGQQPQTPKETVTYTSTLKPSVKDLLAGNNHYKRGHSFGGGMSENGFHGLRISMVLPLMSNSVPDRVPYKNHLNLGTSAHACRDHWGQSNFTCCTKESGIRWMHLSIGLPTCLAPSVAQAQAKPLPAKLDKISCHTSRILSEQILPTFSRKTSSTCNSSINRTTSLKRLLCVPAKPLQHPASLSCF